jgi:hypothetical protein
VAAGVFVFSVQTAIASPRHVRAGLERNRSFAMHCERHVQNCFGYHLRERATSLRGEIDR